MEQALVQLLEMNRDPVLVLQDGRIVHMNSEAVRQFPGLVPGAGAAGLLPDFLLSETAETFYSSAVIGGTSFTVHAARQGELLLLSLCPAAAPEELRGCLSDSLMNEMLSALCNIGLAAERLSRQEDAILPEKQKYLTALYRNYHQLNHRLSNLNTFCALSEDTMRVLPRRTDLAAMCRELTASVNLMTGEDRARVECEDILETLPAFVDAPKIERLLLNLLSNSLKNTPKDGTVRLRLAKLGEKALFSADDTGCGIPPEMLRTVFCGFENRLTERNLSLNSTGGLGLGICRAIAEKHGGTLILESRVGKGTCIRLLLPLTVPGTDVLRSETPVYASEGVSLLLTELCDVLDAAAYRPEQRE